MSITKEPMRYNGLTTTDLKLYDESKVDYRTNNFTVSSTVNKKFSAKHTNRTGFVYRIYNFDINNYSAS
jgi:hypothetical protein